MTDKKRILIIDDNRSLTLTAQRILENEGYAVLTAPNGFEGLRKAREEKPDLIILDIEMPGMNGYEVGRELQSNPNTASIPIIFLSVKGNIDEKEGLAIVGSKEIYHAYECGAYEFLHKPVTANELISTVKNTLRLNNVLSSARTNEMP
jgi:CheY-like chemotaxis protein